MHLLYELLRTDNILFFNFFKSFDNFPVGNMWAIYKAKRRPLTYTGKKINNNYIIYNIN